MPDTELRRAALSLTAQLPENRADALRVIAYMTDLVNGFVAVEKPQLKLVEKIAPLKIVTRGGKFVALSIAVYMGLGILHETIAPERTRAAAGQTLDRALKGGSSALGCPSSALASPAGR